MKNTFNKHIKRSSLSKGMTFLVLTLCIGFSQLRANTYHDNQHLQFWLSTLKQSPFILLQKNAARQLGLMGDMRAKSELEYQAINHPSHEVRAEALYALGRMGSMGSMAVLQRALNKETHPEAQKQAQLALDILEKRRDYIEQLKEQKQ
ncbi:MAG TPA: HEAT repeat domain-containing protein [Oligoflexia bacterium]|nr:HEAT repeat domain-containing protein [Oligoflexia bacterium]HMR24429.1 HEAT repeat domain-containing protein [Oligoflexia bacterium]